MKNKERLFWLFSTMLLAAYSFFPFEKAKAISLEGEKFLQVFHEISALIDSDFVETSEDKNLYQGAIKGMISTLGDPHTRFMDEEEFKQLQEETRGSFGGVGMEVAPTEGGILVVAPIDDTPAQRAGVQPQDKIIEINGQNTEKMSIQDAIKIMRGAPGTSVNLKIRRKSVKDPVSLSLIREQIRIQFLKKAFLENEKLGYIRLSQFMGKEATLNDFKRILGELRSKNMKGLIVDLRSNPGGLLDLAIELSDLFLPENKDIVSVKGRGEKLIRVFKSTGRPDKFTDIPMVVLMNGGSASASEIFAGAMQDHKRASILGTQSFGKGSVQNIYPLSYKTGIALTIQKYYTPSGVSIHKKGITPDLVTEAFGPDEDEKFYLEKMQKGNLLSPFVKEHPGFNERNLDLFIEILQKKSIKIRPELARYLLKREYSVGEKLPVFDREFDVQLNKAIEVLSKNK